MVSSNGFRWDGIVVDVNMFGWIKRAPQIRIGTLFLKTYFSIIFYLTLFFIYFPALHIR
jgi:hypothetical protein